MNRDKPKLRTDCEDDKDILRRIRYGGRRYKQTCAISFKSTNRRCTCCNVDLHSPVSARRRGIGGERISEFHHFQYFSKWLWVKDCWRAMRGEEIEEVWGAVVPDREQIGIHGVTLCRKCHDWVHEGKRWKRVDVEQLIVPVGFLKHPALIGWFAPAYRNRNRWWVIWWLRFLWQWRTQFQYPFGLDRTAQLD